VVVLFLYIDGIVDHHFFYCIFMICLQTRDFSSIVLPIDQGYIILFDSGSCV
jgi:hypothetical protein